MRSLWHEKERVKGPDLAMLTLVVYLATRQIDKPKKQLACVQALLNRS